MLLFSFQVVIHLSVSSFAARALGATAMATRKGRRKKVFCRRAGGKVFGGVHLPLVGGQRWCYEFSPPQKGLPGDGHTE
ncbi:hypothetical protein BOM25_13350, partial [Serratia sp. OPWLW2]